MFFIMGISNGEKKLNFDQLEVCGRCGQYGHVQVYITYMYLMLFFIPVFKWNKRYYAKMSCCGATCEINPEMGRSIQKGEITHLSTENLHFSGRENTIKQCSYCGFSTMDDYQYCPKCGRAL